MPCGGRLGSQRLCRDRAYCPLGCPETFRLLPIWVPEHARRQPFYKGGWWEPQLNKSRSSGSVVHKVEGNVYANQALRLARGLRKANRPNWSCCHLWGVDDGTYQKSSVVVQDRRFYSCLANRDMERGLRNRTIVSLYKLAQALSTIPVVLISSDEEAASKG